MQGTLGIVFVSCRPAEIDAQAIPEVLGHMPFKLGDDFGGGCLIGTDHLTQDFRGELLGECRGVGEVAEHHGQFTAFSLKGASGGLRR